MKHLRPTARLYPCQRIDRHNGKITINHRGQLLIGEEHFFLAHGNTGGAECEGVLHYPPHLRGTNIHVDLFRDRTRGIFSVYPDLDMPAHPNDYFAFFLIHEESHHIETHIGCEGIFTPSILEIATESGVLRLRRNCETFWGPDRFRGITQYCGPITVFVS
jgi:hypothetical protein